MEHAGRDRGLYLLSALREHARELGVTSSSAPYSAYRNTISVDEQPAHPGNLALEERLTALMRWNALAMVVNHAAGRGDSRTAIRIDHIDDVLQACVTRAVHILECAVRNAR